MPEARGDQPVPLEERLFKGGINRDGTPLEQKLIGGSPHIGQQGQEIILRDEDFLQLLQKGVRGDEASMTTLLTPTGTQTGSIDIQTINNARSGRILRGHLNVRHTGGMGTLLSIMEQGDELFIELPLTDTSGRTPNRRQVGFMNNNGEIVRADDAKKLIFPDTLRPYMQLQDADIAAGEDPRCVYAVITESQ